MMTYAIAKDSQAVSELVLMLEAHGFERTTADVADVVLLASDSDDRHLDVALTSLGEAAKKTIVVGDLPRIDNANEPEQGTLESTLETFQPLGVLYWPPRPEMSPWTHAGFVGSKALAEKLGAGVWKDASTAHYGNWIRRDCGVVDFIRRIIAAATGKVTPTFKLKLGHTYRVMWSEEGQRHIGLCDEFPSLSWLSPTQNGALTGIVTLVADVLKDMAKNNEPIPAPLPAPPEIELRQRIRETLTSTYIVKAQRYNADVTDLLQVIDRLTAELRAALPRLEALKRLERLEAALLSAGYGIQSYPIG